MDAISEISQRGFEPVRFNPLRSFLRSSLLHFVYTSLLFMIVVHGSLILSDSSNSPTLFIAKASVAVGCGEFVITLLFDVLPGLYSIRQFIQFFGLSTWGPNGHGFVRKVHRTHDLSWLVRTTDDILSRHKILARTDHGRMTEWRALVGPGRFRVLVADLDDGSTVIAVEPTSWFRYWFTAGEGVGGPIVGAILLAAIQKGCISADIDVSSPPRGIRRDLTNIVEPVFM